MCSFKKDIECAIRNIQEGQIEEAKRWVSEAMLLRPEAPEPHNLLGIIAEYTGDMVSARKHYRASWALDEAYQPAYKNLDRLTSNYSNKVLERFEFGVRELMENE